MTTDIADLRQTIDAQSGNMTIDESAVQHGAAHANAIPSPAARQQLFQMALGGLVTQLLHAAAELGIADLLSDGPRRCEDLAHATGTHAPSLQRVLRALASLGVFTEVENGTFGLTPLAACMRSDIPESFRIMPIYLGSELYRTWGELIEGVRTGEPIFETIYGTSYFGYMAQNPEAAETFNAAMTALGAAAETPAVVAAYDFTDVGSVIDVGGGEGSLLAAILQANPGVKGILFDLPPVVASAQSRIEEAGVAGRCELVAGDFFEAVPEGGNVYLMKRIIHDWDDERCITILRNCRRAMSSAARLLVVEAILPPGDEPAIGKLVDVVMMTILHGGERNEVEYRALFRAGGFELTRVLPTASPMSIIEGRPV